MKNSVDRGGCYWLRWITPSEICRILHISLAALILYSRGKFVLKASNWSRSIKKTSNNKKNLVTSFVTRTEAFRGGGVKISLIDYASKRGWGIKCLTTLQTVDKVTPK